MPRTIRVKLFKYSELAEHNQKKVLQRYYDLNVDYQWWEFTYDDAEQIGLKLTGFDEAFYCTGELLVRSKKVADLILENHGEDTTTYKSAQKFLAEIQQLNRDEKTDEYDEFYEKFENGFLFDLLRDYKKILSDEYDYRTSDEQIIETIDANDYEFLEDGTTFNQIKVGKLKK